MEHDYTELVIGYLQGNLSKEETDLFYDWVNESASNKETFFEIKAMYDAGLFLGKPLDTASSWQRLLNKKKNSQTRRFNLWYQISSYAAVALIAVAISSVFFLFIRDDDGTLYSKYIGGDGLEADVIELPDGTHVMIRILEKINVLYIWKVRHILKSPNKRINLLL